MYVVGVIFRAPTMDLAEKLAAELKATAERVLSEYTPPTDESMEGFGAFELPTDGQSIDEWLRQHMGKQRPNDGPVTL